MPFNSLSKLKNSLLSDNASLLPPERRVYIKTGYGGVVLGAKYTGTDGLVNNLIPSSRVENYSGYVIYRATGLNGPWTAMGGSQTQSPDIAPNTVGGVWTDLTATGDFWYYYSGAGYKTGVGGSSFLYTIPSSNVVSGRGAPVINATGGQFTYIVSHPNPDGIHSSTTSYLNDPSYGNYIVAYKLHTYTGTANFVTNANSATTQLTAVLLAGGGGAGGKNQGGGGGGGGLLSLSGSTAPTVNPNTTYTITIGAGASSNLGGGSAIGANGGNSIAFGYTGYGGGGGGSVNENGSDGGCGGGAGGGGTVGGAPKTGYGWLGNNTYSGRQGLSGHSAYDGGNGGGGGGLFPNNTYNSVLNGKEPTNWGYSGFLGYAAYIKTIYRTYQVNTLSLIISAGGGAGGDNNRGYGGGQFYTNPGGSGAGEGSYDWGADYYGDPAGKGYDATSYGCGGGGGGKGGGGGGAGFRGICYIMYPVSGAFVDTYDYGRVFATGG
jgi:hypothetical protein